MATQPGADEDEEPFDDPIVAEVRRTRERILAEAGGDLKKLVARLREMEASLPQQPIVLPPRRERPIDDVDCAD
jgi:hypothetical protein